MTKFDRYAAVVLDIEGTTTAISFVYDQLFPYARRAMNRFLTNSWRDPGVQGDLHLVEEQAATDLTEGVEGVPVIPPRGEAEEVRREAFVANLLWQMDNDRKTTGLKALQGRIWVAGYRDGALRGHLFDDVEPALAEWNGRGVPVYIYSSGSVAAQKLLFGHTEAGDLTSMLAGYFDTTVGNKRASQSYVAIAGAIDRRPRDLLFVTDRIEEARAARQAGLQVALSVRPGNAPLPREHSFPVVRSLEETL